MAAIAKINLTLTLNRLLQIQPNSKIFSSPIISSYNLLKHTTNLHTISMAASTTTPLDLSFQEQLPPTLDGATAVQPPLFDGTIRLYTAYICPFAQRVWITRNIKGLQEKIKIIPLNLSDRPSWYSEKVYPANKVPALEHNGKIIGESVDLIKYIDSNFDGPSLFPEDSAKKAAAEELFAFADTFSTTYFTAFKGDPVKDSSAALDNFENALQKFDDGPFLLGQFSLIDITFIPFVERFQVFFREVYNHDITVGRPKLAAYIEEINKIGAYTQTKRETAELVAFYKNKFQIQ